MPKLLSPIAVTALVAMFLARPLSAGSAAPLAPAASQPAGKAVTLSATASGEPFSLMTTQHFKLVYAGDAKWIASMGKLLESAQKEFCDSLHASGIDVQAPASPLVWVCFGRHGDFEAYAEQADRTGASWSDGYYSMRTNIVAVAQIEHNTPATAPAGAIKAQTGLLHEVATASAGIDVVRTTHEAAHQLAFNCGLQKRGVLYPIWVSEGLATNFEADDAGKIGFGRDCPVRRDGLAAARDGKRLIALSEMIALTQAPDGAGEDARDVYAESWGLFHFLLKERPRELRNYLRTLAGLSPGQRSAQTLRDEFTAAFGPVDKLEPAWSKFLLALPKE